MFSNGSFKDNLIKSGAEVISCPETVDGRERNPTFARLLVASDPTTVDRYNIIRDVDARLSSREWFAVHD